MKLPLIALAVIVTIACLGSREGFVDFGLSGYKKPIGRFAFAESTQNIDVSSMTPEEGPLSPDEIATVIKSIQEYVKSKHDVCLHPVQTIYINKYSPDIYDARIMFYNTTYHFGTELVATLSGKTISSIRTSIPAEAISGPVGFTDDTSSPFLPADEVLKNIVPSKADLSAIGTTTYNSQ